MKFNVAKLWHLTFLAYVVPFKNSTKKEGESFLNEPICKPIKRKMICKSYVNVTNTKVLIVAGPFLP